jgi:hypothetical protein
MTFFIFIIFGDTSLQKSTRAAANDVCVCFSTPHQWPPSCFISETIERIPPLHTCCSSSPMTTGWREIETPHQDSFHGEQLGYTAGMTYPVSADHHLCQHGGSVKITCTKTGLGPRYQEKNQFGHMPSTAERVAKVTSPESSELGEYPTPVSYIAFIFFRQPRQSHGLITFFVHFILFVCNLSA